MRINVRKSWCLSVVLLVSVIYAGQAHALVRNDDTVGTPAANPAAVMVSVPGGTCSGTIICGGKWIITAAHCISSLVGANYSFTDTGGNTLTGKGTVQVHGSSDLAMIEVNGMFANSAGLFMGNVNGLNVSFTGWGRSSDAAGGDGGGPGTGGNELPSGTARQGTNTLDLNVGNSVRFDFDNPGGASEATTFGGDSGMGYMSGNQLVGVHTGITVGANLNQPGVVSFGVNIQPHLNWITTKGNPEPASLAVWSVLGGMGLIVARRRRKAEKRIASAAE